MKYINIISIKNSKNTKRATGGFFILILEFENEYFMPKQK
jgi:hypothetical protein